MIKTSSKLPSVILIRHAQSQWNLENRFSGWADPLLTAEGEREARNAGIMLRQKGFQFDHAYCSYLQRTRQTLDIMLSELQQSDLTITEDWRLNERHYGSLQGKIKTPEANNTTEEQIWRWRRSYLDKAEPLALDDPRHPRNNPRYGDVSPERLPAVENLAETRIRIAEFWQQQIIEKYSAGATVLISAHGNSLRALLMELAQMSVTEVESFEIPTGTPIAVEKQASNDHWQWHYMDH